jgi:hypothetical protein
MAKDGMESRYPRLNVPRFDSKIPSHLLNRLSDQEKWLVETLSKLGQKADWLMDTIMRTNAIHREIDVRLVSVERFTGKWAVIGGACVMVITAFLGAFAKTAFSHIWP